MTDVALAPLGWTQYLEHPPTFTPEQWVRIVNLFVNGAIMSESGLPPGPDTLRVWPTTGWCHDFAITKYYELRLRGIPANEMRLCECIAHGVKHMVLVVDLPSGSVVLDNLNPRVRPLAQLGYTIDEIGNAPAVWKNHA